MMNCRRATRLMSEAQERELSLGERAGLKFHTTMCSGCRNFGQQMQMLRRISHAFSKGADEKISNVEEHSDDANS